MIVVAGLNVGDIMKTQLENAKDSLQGLKFFNSRKPCERPMWSEDETECVIYVSCGIPCEKPCELCLVWGGYGAILDERDLDI